MRVAVLIIVVASLAIGCRPLPRRPYRFKARPNVERKTRVHINLFDDSHIENKPGTDININLFGDSETTEQRRQRVAAQRQWNQYWKDNPDQDVHGMASPMYPSISE